MHEYRIHTLVDITDNGNLKQQFPFTTSAGVEVHDKHTLAIARNQNSNFSTLPLVCDDIIHIFITAITKLSHFTFVIAE